MSRRWVKRIRGRLQRTLAIRDLEPSPLDPALPHVIRDRDAVMPARARRRANCTKRWVSCYSAKGDSATFGVPQSLVLRDPRIASPMSLLQTSPRSRRSAFRAVFAAASVLMILTACSHFRTAPSPDIATTKMSAHGLYRASVRLDVEPIPVRRLQHWTLHIDTMDGRPVDAATITMNGGMPQHGHGLPTSPRVTRALGNGDHLVEGVKFNMGGWWVVKFRVASSAGADSVVFNLSL